MKRTFWFIAIGIILIFLLTYFFPSTGKLETVTIKKGASFSQIANELEEQDVIGSKTLFSLYVRIFGDE